MLRVLFAVAVAAGFSGCGEQKANQPQDAGTPDASPNQALLGGKLGEAVAAAAAAPTSSASAKRAGGDEGPPPNGVLGPEAALRAHAPGAPARLELFSEGNEPRLSLMPKAVGGAEQKRTFTIALRAQLPINIDVDMSFKPEKAKDGADKGDAKKTKEAAKDEPKEANAAPLAIVGSVESATVTSQLGAPPELVKALEKLKGSEIRFTVRPDGTPADFSQQLAKGADKGVESVLGALVESAQVLLAPVPQKPVGAGAYWMVTDRTQSAAGEMVRYRVFRLTSLDGETAKLSLEVRQYAASATLSVAAGPQNDNMDLPIDRFESRGKGDISRSAASFLPVGGEVQSQTAALVIAPGNQRAQVASEMSVRISSK